MWKHGLKDMPSRNLLRNNLIFFFIYFFLLFFIEGNNVTVQIKVQTNNSSNSQMKQLLIVKYAYNNGDLKKGNSMHKIQLLSCRINVSFSSHEPVNFLISGMDVPKKERIKKL